MKSLKTVLKDKRDVEQRLENLEELSKIKILRNCHELGQHGIQKNGIYLVDPDGEMIGHAPIYVYCDFENGITEIFHDMEELIKVEKCDEAPGCSVYNLTYSAPKEQIEALVQLSTSCSQVRISPYTSYAQEMVDILI